MAFMVVFLGSFLTAFSGALAPGPLLFYTIARSSKHGWLTGVFVIAGHALLELVIVLLLIFGMKSFMNRIIFEMVLSLTGGLTLIVMGVFTFKPLYKKENSIDLQEITGTKKYNFNLFAGGFVISLSNPYFLLWWFFIGAGYLFASMKLGILGVLAFFAGHTLADFIWYIFVSFFVSKSKKMIQGRWFNALILICGILIVFMGVLFVINGIRLISG